MECLKQNNYTIPKCWTCHSTTIMGGLLSREDSDSNINNKYLQQATIEMKTTPSYVPNTKQTIWSSHPCFVGLAYYYQGKDIIVFIEYSS